MTDSQSKNPVGWDDYHFGSSPRQGSMTSNSNRIQFNDDPNPAGEASGVQRRSQVEGQDTETLRRKGSALSLRLNTIRQTGGVNSIDNFARSWQRAAGFHEITNRRPSFIVSTDDEAGGGDFDEGFGRRDEERGPATRSLLRAELQRQKTSESALEESESPGPSSKAAAQASSGGIERISRTNSGDIFSVAPHLESPFSASFGTSYGTLSSRVNDVSMRHAAQLFQEQQLAGPLEPDKEREPLLVRRVQQDDGKIVNVIVGQSTLPQTVFNSVNVLVGVGLLSLPLGIKYAGWLIGLLFLSFSAVITSYTARILAKCLDVDSSLVTFADLAYVSYGSKARVATSILFSLELVAACVALIVLFADSLDALIPGWGTLAWKVLCGIILMPLAFLPLRVLSFSSVIGIVCCFGIVSIFFIDGLLKPHSPGSLREPAKTFMFPENWSTLPLSFGLLMSPWGGHSVFPNIYRDMRHPRKYHKGLNITYIFTYVLDASMAVAGYIMFGEKVRDEITANILKTEGYPAQLSVAIVVFIAIIPLTKVPLNARPIISTLEIFTGLDSRVISDAQAFVGMSGFNRGLLKVLIRCSCIIFFVIIAIAFPSFDRIMALLGSALCFSVCVILPLVFYLKIFGDEISLKERVVDYALIGICSVMAVTGTVWAFLPKSALESG